MENQNAQYEPPLSLRLGDPPQAPGLRVTRLLGVGGSAAVWAAEVRESSGAPPQGRDRPSGPVWCHGGAPPQTVALKVSTTPSTEPGHDQRLHAELEAMRPLHHDHLVTPYGWVPTSHGPGLVIELFSAGSLAALLRARGRLSAGEVTTVLTPVAEAVAHLHREGAVHGDICPGNILLAPDGRPAVGDLGDAQLLGGAPTPVGTPGFTAPERHAADSAAETATETATETALACEADVYSLGAVAWFALTGQHPDVDARRAPLGTLCPELSTRAIDLIEETLSDDPHRRPSAQEFAIGLFVAASPEELDVSPYVDDEVVADLPTRRRPDPRPRRRRGRRSAFIAVTAAVLSAGAWWMWPAGQSLDSEGSEQAAAEQFEHNAGADDSPEAGEEAAAEAGSDPADSDPAGSASRLSVEAAEQALESEEPEEILLGLQSLRLAALENPQEVSAELYTAEGSPAQETEELLLEQAPVEGPELSLELLGSESEGGLEDGPEQQIAPSDPETSEELILPVAVTAGEFTGEGHYEQQVRLAFVRDDERWMLHQVHELV